MFSGRLEKRIPKEGEPLGPYGEEIAVSYLQTHGYRIIERNYRKRYGEIDIIAEDDDEIVFVEVKTRRSNRFGSPFEAIDRRKQIKMSRVALAYLNSRRMIDRAARFDVVAVRLENRYGPTVEVIRDAFELCNG